MNIYISNIKHKKFADQISKCIDESAKMRGTGIARRTPEYITKKIEAGTVYINNYFNAATQSPVGGYKQSGYGRENGWEGMRCFMQTKSVWLSTNPNEPTPF